LMLVAFCFSVDAQVTQGDVVPDFTLKDMDGNERTLYEYEDYVIFFNIFGATDYYSGKEAPYLETDIWQYYNNMGGNANGVPVMVIGYSDITGAWSGSGGKYSTGLKEMKNFIDEHNITYTILIEDKDGGVDNVGQSVFGVTEFPANAIINGTPNDPNFLQWEAIYYGEQFDKSYVDMYKGYIDEVNPAYDPLLTFDVNQDTFYLADTLNSSLNVRYFGEISALDLYVALMAFGKIYFYPSWSRTPGFTPLTLSNTYNQDFNLLTGIPISTTLPEGTYSFAAICAEPGTLNPVGAIATQDFNILHQEIPRMITYFEENPVYNEDQGSSGLRTPFTIYLENTGQLAITIDTFTIDNYDADGNFDSSQDASGNFSSWFDLTFDVLPVGQAASATLSMRNTENIERQAQFYFHGTANGFEIELTSERLIMLPMQAQ